WRLLDAAVGRAGNRVQLDLDRLGELARLLPVGALREVPEHEVPVGAGGGARRTGRRTRRSVLAAGDLLRDLVGCLEREIVGLGALGRGRARGIRVDRQEEVGLLVVCDRGTVVQRNEQVRVARQDGAAGQYAGERGRDAFGDLQGGVFLLQAARSDGA